VAKILLGTKNQHARVLSDLLRGAPFKWLLKERSGEKRCSTRREGNGRWVPSYNALVYRFQLHVASTESCLTLAREANKSL